MSEENTDIIKNTKKSVIKTFIRESLSKLIPSLIVGLFSACNKLAEKLKVKQEGETRWYMVLLYAILVAALSAGAVLGTQYSAELTDWVMGLFSFLN